MIGKENGAVHMQIPIWQRLTDCKFLNIDYSAEKFLENIAYRQNLKSQ